MSTYAQMVWLTFDAEDEAEAERKMRRLLDAAERGAVRADDAANSPTLEPEGDLERS